MGRLCTSGCALWLFLVTLPLASRADSPPNTPTIVAPPVDGYVVNAADVHMETAPFFDPDRGDTHAASDWEIRTIVPDEVVWSAYEVTGLSAVHIHLGDGIFINSHLGRADLFPATNYLLRVRHKDSSGNPSKEWSAWAQRFFTTGPPTQVFPMAIHDARDIPEPTWWDDGFTPIVLPPGATPPTLILGSATGDSVLGFVGNDGVTNVIVNPPPLSEHVDARVAVSAGDVSVALVPSEVRFTNDEGNLVKIALPSMVLSPGQSLYFWVASDGSTFYGTAAQTEPDFTDLARGAKVPWLIEEPGYVVEVAASGFQLPVTIAFVPSPGAGPGDPLYYVAELYGTIKVVTNDGSISDYATGLLNFNPTGNFPGSGEQGLVGLAVDAASGDVFATLVYSENPMDELAPHHPKVIRLSSADGGLTAASESTVLDMPSTVESASHQISTVTIGGDGKLYVHLGDGFVPSAAQDTTQFLGKILRLNSDGTPPADNPFYSPVNGISAADYIYGYGFRNPFGGGWRWSDGRFFIADNGLGKDRLTELVAGRNYLFDGSDESMANYAIYNWFPSVAPVKVAVINPSVFGGSGFPAEKWGHVFVSESGPTWATGTPSRGKRIGEFEIDAGGQLVGDRSEFMRYVGVGKATVAALAQGPDGLYFSDLYKDQSTSPIEVGARVLRIRFVGVVDFLADQPSGPAPHFVSFTDISTMPSPSEWLWTFGDGDSSTAQNPSHTYEAGGVYTVTLQVTNANGVGIESKSAYIVVGYPSGVGGEPGRFVLRPSFPNPFSSSTSFSFETPYAADVELVIYDVAGRLVRQLVSGYRRAGIHTVTWDGRSDAGSETASGIYFYRVAVRRNGEPLLMDTRKLMRLR